MFCFIFTGVVAICHNAKSSDVHVSPWIRKTDCWTCPSEYAHDSHTSTTTWSRTCEDMDMGPVCVNRRSFLFWGLEGWTTVCLDTRSSKCILWMIDQIRMWEVSRLFIVQQQQQVLLAPRVLNDVDISGRCHLHGMWYHLNHCNPVQNKSKPMKDLTITTLVKRLDASKCSDVDVVRQHVAEVKHHHSIIRSIQTDVNQATSREQEDSQKSLSEKSGGSLLGVPWSGYAMPVVVNHSQSSRWGGWSQKWLFSAKGTSLLWIDIHQGLNCSNLQTANQAYKKSAKQMA